MERADLEQWKAREVARLLSLVESERRYYQEIASAAPVGLLVVARDLVIVSANRAVRKIFGLSKSPLRTSLDTLLPAAVAARVPEVLDTAIPHTGISAAEPKSGRPLRIAILSIRAWDDESGPEALITVEDLSDAGSAGVPVPSGAGTGPQSPERRLLEEQWVQAERVQAVQKLAARLAHDLNNMLMIASGHAEEVLAGLPAANPLRADVQEIVSANERMTALTQHLLAFTRKQTVQPGEVDLAAALRGLPERAGIEIRPAAASIVVKANEDLLEQTLLALMEGEAQLRIEASRATISEDLAQFGAPLRPGAYGVIALSMARRMEDGAKHGWFEAALPIKGAADDFAVRVTRAYGIVRQWGGDIAVVAEPDGGTLVRIFLEAVSSSAAAQVEGAASGQTILVVDDEPRIRALVQKILSRHGYQVLEAADGQEALAVFRDHPEIDLLITDVMMPRMGGAELVEQLRRQRIGVKVLYVSGYTDDPKILAGKFPPGTAFLAKPFTIAALTGKVREVLEAR